MHMEYECVREKPGGLPSHQFTWNLGGEGKDFGEGRSGKPIHRFQTPPKCPDTQVPCESLGV